MTWETMPIFDHSHRKLIEVTFSFPKFVKACKKQVYSINLLLRYSQFQSLWPELSFSFLIISNQKILNQL